jgi:hypothetical protein
VLRVAGESNVGVSVNKFEWVHWWIRWPQPRIELHSFLSSW